MQPTGGRGMPGVDPRSNVAMPTNTSQATSVFPVLQQIVTLQHAQLSVLRLILASPGIKGPPPNLPGGGIKSEDALAAVGMGAILGKMSSKIHETMDSIKGLMIKSAVAGTPGGSSTTDKTMHLLLASFGMFLTPAVMLAAAGMLTLAELINSKLIPQTGEIVKGFANVAFWSVDAAKAIGEFGTGMSKEEKDAAAKRSSDRMKQQPWNVRAGDALYGLTGMGQIDNALKKAFGGPMDRIGRDSQEERTNEERRRFAQTHQRELMRGGGMAPPVNAAVEAVKSPMQLLTENMRKIIADMRTNIAKPPEFSSIEGLWQKMQMRVYESPLDQLTRQYQERSLKLMEEVVRAIEGGKPPNT